MGLMDRDYYRDKVNKNSRVEDVFTQIERQLEKQEKRKKIYKKLLILFVLTLLGFTLFGVVKFVNDKKTLREILIEEKIEFDKKT